MKKFVFLAVLSLGAVSTLVVFLLISSVSFLGSQIGKIEQIPENIASPLCREKVQSLATIESWLVRPPLENWRNFKEACLNQAPAPCEGQECRDVKNFLRTAERGVL